MSIQKLTSAAVSAVNKPNMKQRLINTVSDSIHQQNAKQQQIGRFIGALKEIKAQKEEDIMDILSEPLSGPLPKRILNKITEIISYF